MIRSLLLAAALSCALACLPSVAEARPISRLSVKHLDRQSVGQGGCSQPEMRPCGVQVVAKSAGRLKIGRWSRNRQVEQGGRPRAWCGWQMRQWMGVRNPAGNLARWWAGYGSRAHGPAVGAIVVWRHHVGIITGKTERGWVVLSGNDGNAVRERVRSVAGAVAFRWP